MVDILTRSVKRGLSEEVALKPHLRTDRMPGSQPGGGEQSQVERTADSKGERAWLVPKAIGG